MFKSGENVLGGRLLQLLLPAFLASMAVSCVTPAAKQFTSPQEAVDALVLAARHNSEKELAVIFGSGGEDVFASGDAVRDQLGRERFLQVYEATNSLVAEGEAWILVVGQEQWPFPVPLVKKGNAWAFDTAKGLDELLSRRVGRNESATIHVCLAIVDAQREYAMKDRDGDGILAYAGKWVSDPGQHNGLYWKTNEGEPPSPLGTGVARAKEAGYGARHPEDEPIPFFGYYYRLLKAQGKDAPGGAYEYDVNGKMIGGFAVVAYPAQYGNSGVMTFIVNHDGIVYQKDLGENSARLAREMTEFNCDGSWTKAGDADTRVEE